jgi:antitoxin VapB
MSMNIKNEEAHRLARELAQRTGSTVTGVVLEALREKRDRLGSPGPADRKAALLEIGRRTAPLLKGIDTDHDHLLYDDEGMPA